MKIHNRKRLDQDLKESKPCEVIITIKKRGRRSNQQNRYLFGIAYAECRLAFLNLGHRLTIEETHEFFKKEFLPVHIHDGQGTVIATFSGTTTDMNKEEFSQYIERIREYAAINLGIDIPDADKSLALDF